MGWRFHRRVRICKGVNLNFSKSGIGVSVWTPFGRVSTGPNGSYLTTTVCKGVSYRQKLDTQSKNSNYVPNQTISESTYVSGSKYVIQIDEKGNESVYFEDPSGNRFTSEDSLKQLLRSSEYKEALRIIRQKKCDIINEENETVVNIYRKTPAIVSKEQVIQEMGEEDFGQEFYDVNEYNEPSPKKDNFYNKAVELAEQNVKTIAFWKKKKLKSLYIQTKMEELYNTAYSEWESRKKEFDDKELSYKQEVDAHYKEIYDDHHNKKKSLYKKILSGDKDYLLEAVPGILGQIQLPVEFAIDFDIDGTTVYLDIDLPEIEDMPSKKASVLANGSLSIKDKSQTDLFSDYATSVIGLAFYFSGVVFNISPEIKDVKVAGYTQRISKKTGNEEDQYVYYINFERGIFSKLKCKNIDPIEAIENFDHIIAITSKKELKTIEVPEFAGRHSDANSQIVTDGITLIEEPSISYAPPEREEQVWAVKVNTLSSISKADVEKKRQTEAQQERNRRAERDRKGCIGCLVMIAIAFICLLIGFCSIVSNSSRVNHKNNARYRTYVYPNDRK